MPGDGNSFLPRLRSVFYARFDELRGPEIAYQVPEGLIASSAAGFVSGTASPAPSGSSRASSIIFAPHDRSSESRTRTKASPHKNSSSSRTLLNFDDISKYIIAQSPLCGRLVTCAAGTYKVLGFPVELLGDYERHYFRFNVCFVFDASADLSCYEPIIRKVNRVLTACEVSAVPMFDLQATAHPLKLEGRVVIPVIARNILQNPCHPGAAIRRPELLLRDVYPNRQLQLDRAEDISFLPKSTSS
jgi:hypothetical protein